jgi:putative tricarboxylic transport membrane protein
VTAFFGIFGYYTSRWGCEGAPFILGFVLGPLMEENLRRAMLISRGDASVFFSRPISAGMLAVTFFLLILIVVHQIRKKRAEVIVEGAD